MRAEILIGPAKWRMCVSDPAISQLHPPAEWALRTARYTCALLLLLLLLLQLLLLLLPAAPHQARMSTSITQKYVKVN